MSFKGIRARYAIAALATLLLHAAGLFLITHSTAMHRSAVNDGIMLIQLPRSPPGKMDPPVRPTLINGKGLQRIMPPASNVPSSVAIPEGALPVDDSPVQQRPERESSAQPPVAAQPAGRAPADYAALVAQQLAAVKHYPENARAFRNEGTVWASLEIGRSGKLISWTFVRHSGFRSLDGEVAEMIAAAGQFPEFPQEWHKDKETFVVPVEFSLK